jgi:hypothetical protein
MYGFGRQKCSDDALRAVHGDNIDAKEALKAVHAEQLHKDAKSGEHFMDTYINLDSWVSDITKSEGVGEIAWNIAVHTTTSDDIIGVIDPIHDIQYIEIGGPFDVPSVEDFSLTGSRTIGGEFALGPIDPVIAPGTFNPLKVHDKVHIEIQDVATHGIRGRNNTRYHFEAQVGTEAEGRVSLDCTATHDGRYLFPKPLRAITLDGIKVRFHVGANQPLNLPPSKLAVTARVRDDGPDKVVSLESEASINLAEGDYIVLKSQTGIPYLDRYLGSRNGHLVGDVTTTAGSTTFRLNPPIRLTGSLATTPDGETLGQGNVTVFIAKNRVQIPLKIRTLSSEVTQGMSHND